MAMQCTEQLAGVDVCKAELVVCAGAHQASQTIANRPQAIRAWLRSLAGPWSLAVEPTSTFHLELITQAHQRGMTIYLVDGLRLNRYRESIGGRVKTDASDAALLRRYLSHERADLRPWTPPPAGYDAMLRLLRRRAQLVRHRDALRQSLAGLSGAQPQISALMRAFKSMERRINDALQQQIKDAGWYHDQKRCQAIEGIGPLTSAALAVTFRRGPFRNSDAFVAFAGLDIRIRDSGTMRGRGKLTKQGSAEMRRLLYLAAMTASRSPRFKPYYQNCRNRGMATTQAYVALARKLLRIAYALMKNQAPYQPKALSPA